MNKEQAMRFARGLMETSEAAYLTTIGGDGFPQTRAMLNLRNRQQFPTLVELFAAHQDDLLVHFTTNTSSAKMEQIRANPRVSVYFCNPASFHGLMLAGVIQVVADSRLKRDLWQEGWERYYPSGPEDPDHTVLRLAPAVAKGWHGEGRFEFRIDK